MTRRQALAYAGAAALTAATASFQQGCGFGGDALVAVGNAGAAGGAAGEAFIQPAVRAAVAGVLDTALGFVMARNVVNGQSIFTHTYEGKIGGPTLRLKPGERLRFLIVNDFPENEDESTNYPDHNTPKHMNTTNNHTHGLHVSPSGNSDNIFVEVQPKTSFQYEYDIPASHAPGTFWYHPHKHGSSSVQMLGGMGGTLILEGGLDDVPEIAAARDLVFLINELNIDPATGIVPEFVPPANPIEDEFKLEDRLLTVNGTTNPSLRMRPGEVGRLRIVCATVITWCPLVLDGHPLHVIAWDGISLSQLETHVTPVALGPGNRVEVLIKAGAPGTYLLRKLANNVTFADDPEVVFATVVVEGEPLDMPLPTNLPAPFADIQSNEITGTRTLTFSIGFNGPLGPPDMPLPRYLDFSINNERFDATVVQQSVNLNAVEEWTLINSSPSGHPFHIHINHFQVMSINDVPLPKPEWRDTIMIPALGKVVIRHRFLDFTGLFVLHCHILPHEDLGMMHTVNVM